ncbi:hypothetical protein AAIH53_17930, partial [Pseudomonas aeruginosa]|uniref:hypothetical protein n=1 Tax=Pseudomonas aeruginosa TaxID=287 RepID=UPI0031B685F0
VVQVFQNHAHSTFTDFGGVGRSLSHGLIFSRVEASTKPGAIQRGNLQPRSKTFESSKLHQCKATYSEARLRQPV